MTLAATQAATARHAEKRRESHARRASGATAAAKRQREAQRALIFPTGAAAVATGTVVSLWHAAASAMQRPTRCGWTAAEPAPATSGTATCARRGTTFNGTTGLPRAVPTPASRHTTASEIPAGRPSATAAWTRSSTEPAAAVWTTNARTAHAGRMGAKVLRCDMPVSQGTLWP